MNSPTPDGPTGFEKRWWHELVTLPERPSDLTSGLVSPARQVPLVPLRAGAATLEQRGLADIPQGFWRLPSYQSAAIEFVELRHVLCHSSAGIVTAGRFVATDTLIHTLAEEEGYEQDEQGLIRLRSQKISYLPGTAYSLLAGQSGNYYHWMVDSLARLAAIRAKLDTEPGVLLVPPLDVPFRREGLELSLDGLVPPDRLIEVNSKETFLVERLVVPRSVSGGAWSIHPDIVRDFRAIADRTGPRTGPRRIYIDRSGAVYRPMRNARELIERLRPLGFEGIALERLSIREQANLFSGAEIVVGAHGAGLTNLLFASPGCQVVEIYMSTYINWCFYTICAAASLGYGCVIAPVDEMQDGVYYHQQSWEAPVQAVLDAVEAALG